MTAPSDETRRPSGAGLFAVVRLIFDSPNLQTIDRKHESALEKRRGTTLRR
jgi:hypothetical protein